MISYFGRSWYNLYYQLFYFYEKTCVTKILLKNQKTETINCGLFNNRNEKINASKGTYIQVLATYVKFDNPKWV